MFHFSSNLFLPPLFSPFLLFILPPLPPPLRQLLLLVVYYLLPHFSILIRFLLFPSSHTPLPLMSSARSAYSAPDKTVDRVPYSIKEPLIHSSSSFSSIMFLSACLTVCLRHFLCVLMHLSSSISR